MEHVEMYFVNVGFWIMYILSKWIRLQYGVKRYSNLRAFHANQLGRTLGDMLLEGANYVQDFLELFWNWTIPCKRDVFKIILYS